MGLRRKRRTGTTSSEGGSAFIMIMSVILIFSYLALRFWDIPYLERVGQSMQSAAEAAALAGSTQLMARTAMIPTTTDPDNTRRRDGWIFAKQAAIAILKQNHIYGIAGNPFLGLGTTAIGTGTDSIDESLATYTLSYSYEVFPIPNGSVTITRGVYQRPTSSAAIAQNFYPIEDGDSPTRVGLLCATAANLPTECLPTNTLHVWDVADSVRVQITINKVPTLFGKLFGINSFVSITRTATAVPE